MVLAALAASACAPADAPPDYRLDAYRTVLTAEDSRHTAGDNLQVLVAAAASGNAFLRTAGVRALGRLESPELLDLVLALLDDEDPLVRAEAANAAAQAVHRQAGSAALRPLLEGLSREEDPEVLGALARSVGRLSLPADERDEVARALTAVSRGPAGEDAPGPQLLGALLGMGSFLRGAGDGRDHTALLQRLRELVRYGTDQHDQTQSMARVRVAAVTALGTAGALNVDDVGIAFRDTSEEVRRAAAARLSVVAPLARPEFIRRLLQDPSHRVRLEGVRALAREPRDDLTCTRLMTVARREPTTGVRVAALDALSTRCPRTGDQIELLADVAASLEPGMRDWHEAAHGLVALAAVAP
jgi:HEAT repeat protein